MKPLLRYLDWLSEILLPDHGPPRPEMMVGVMVLQVIAYAMVGVAAAVVLGWRP